jgi:beta-N-acetylhexosaminidase
MVPELIGAVLAFAAPTGGTPPAETAVPRPGITWKAIPYGADRKAQMRRYSRRHYGLFRHWLIDPKVIVVHYTASTTFSSAWNTFAANAPDPELRERPGVCTHFIVDTDGTIYQLVPLGTMCRHTVGLNHTSIGIEHVGTSDEQVLGNRRMMRASVRLTRWLRCREGIAIRDVIGHNENTASPHHHERVARLRTQTHGDFPTKYARRYRARVRSAGDC